MEATTLLPPRRRTRHSAGVARMASRACPNALASFCTVRREQSLETGAIGSNPELVAALWQEPQQALVLDQVGKVFF